jgi:tetratricopeptide (TPR) repeat protein
MNPFQEADQKLDVNDFAAAVNLYRAAMKSHEPSAQVLGNLDIAEDADAVQFHSELARLYGRSLTVRMALARCLLASKRSSQALDCCTRALQELLVDPKSEILLRRLRLESALASRQYDIAASDFRFIWQAGEKLPASRAFRRRLLSFVASLNEPKAVEFIDGIRVVLTTPIGIALAEAKLKELVALGAAIDELDPPPDAAKESTGEP